jgi:hypothetical protein
VTPDKDPLMSLARAAFLALLAAPLLRAGPAQALPRADVGSISCAVALDYFATSPADTEVFESFVQGYLAGSRSVAAPRGEARDAAALLAAAIAWCRNRPDADFAAAAGAAVTPRE